MHINKVTLYGTVDGTPEHKQVGSGTDLCKLKLLTEKPVTKKDGSEVTIKAWHRVTLWSTNAQDAINLKEGDPVYLEGEIQYGSYEDKDGVKRYTTDINVGYDGRLVLFPGGGVESTPDNPFN